MSNLAVPFNIALLPVEDSVLTGLKPVTSSDIFDGMSKNFHEDGLYSTTIFGKVGDERRKRRFSYIDIRLPVFHPVIYKALVSLKKMYAEIMAGKAYAVWNDEIKDFVASSPMDGETGYSFFLKYWDKIEFPRRPSDIREESIKLVEKYKKNTKAVLPDKVIVLPAGMRDFEIQGDGRYSEEEINGFYKKLLYLAYSIPKNLGEDDIAIYDSKRVALQRTFNDIYDLFEAMVKGKKKLMLGKWASRKIFNGTRNVITSMSTASNSIGGESNLKFNDTIIGLYQFMKATLPVSIFKLKSGFLSKVFISPNSPAMLVNKLTLRREAVDIRPEVFDGWMTDEGIEKLISRFGESSLRHNKLEVAGHYLGLVYKDDKHFKFFQDITEMPENFDREKVKPITFVELMYVSVYQGANKYPLFVTRYPITSPHSIYPSRTYLKTTALSKILTPLDDNWIPVEGETAHQYPIDGAPFVQSMSPHPSKLASLGADFDGDTASGSICYSDEAIAEVNKLFQSRKFYIGTDGRMNFSTSTDTIKFVLHNMTGDPEDTAVTLEEYSEGKDSTFTHQGVEYGIDKLHEVLREAGVSPSTVFKVEDLKWILDHGVSSPERVDNADTDTPIIVSKESNTLYVIDGFHRLARAVKDNKEELKGYLITDKKLLDAAKV